MPRAHLSGPAQATLLDQVPPSAVLACRLSSPCQPHRQDLSRPDDCSCRPRTRLASSVRSVPYQGDHSSLLPTLAGPSLSTTRCSPFPVFPVLTTIRCPAMPARVEPTRTTRLPIASLSWPSDNSGLACAGSRPSGRRPTSSSRPAGSTRPPRQTKPTPGEPTPIRACSRRPTTHPIASRDPAIATSQATPSPADRNLSAR